MTERNEEPTPRRLRKAREEGDSGVSAYAAQAVAFVVAAVLLPAVTTATAAHVSGELRAAIAHAGDATPSPRFDASALVGAVLLLVLPILAAAGIAGAVAEIVPSGGGLALRKLSPKLERFDVLGGWHRLVSPRRLFAVLRGLVAGSVVVYLAYRELGAHLADLARLPGRLPHLARVTQELSMTLVRDAALVGLVLGAIDFGVARHAWRKRLRMSHDEVKRETKDSEGDPELKAARARAHHEMLRAAALGSLREASVVIVGGARGACALRYDEAKGDRAPVVVASGDGAYAASLARAAERANVPIVRDEPLAGALQDLAIGDAIPEALYDAVAEALREAREREGTT